MSILCWCTTSLIVAALLSIATYIGTTRRQHSGDIALRTRLCVDPLSHLCRCVVCAPVPFLLDGYYFTEQDLKKKYGATWAVVTGSSSGIGRAITTKLARQGVNVVMVAIDDKLLTEVHAQMSKDFPAVQLRKVGVNLGKSGYMAPIIEATRDILPTLIFNNAGFVATGLFSDSPLESLLANYECNATAPVNVTHHFVQRILAESKRSVADRRGAVFFTSSPAGVMPCPTTGQ